MSMLFNQGKVREIIKTTPDVGEAARLIYEYYLEIRGKKELVESVLRMYKKLELTIQEIADRKRISYATVQKIVNYQYL